MPYKIHGDRIYFVGVQFRNENTTKGWPIAAIEGDLVAIKLPSGRCWGGVGRPRNYMPAATYVLRLDVKQHTADVVLTIPFRSTASNENL